MKFLAITIAAITLAEAGSPKSCVAPVMPGIDKCQPCADWEIQQGQCVREGRWFSCYDSIKSCCEKNTEIPNHTDVATCKKQSITKPPTANTPVPPVKHEYCSKVVSKTNKRDNSYCMNLCDKILDSHKHCDNDATFKKSCEYAHFHIDDGRTEIDGSCFNKWVYGYSQPLNLASTKGQMKTDTPAQCQYLCQKDKTCVNWLWVSDLVESTAERQPKQCLLKSLEMVDGALAERMEISKNVNEEYCNVMMPQLCRSHHYECLTCYQHMRCVWRSDMHVAGNKYCDDKRDCFNC